MEYTHRSVLLDECIEGLNIRPDGIYLDGTLGRAGHSSQIAQRLTTGTLICVDRDQAALDAVFDEYAETDSWNLSLLSHGEICWKRSRKGIAPHESSSNPIPLEDIRADADRMQKRRALLEQGLL